MDTIDAKRCDARVAAALIRSSAIDLDGLRSKETVDAAAKALEAFLGERYPDMLPIEVNVGWDQEHGAGRIEIQPKHGRLSEIDWPVLESPEYQEALAAQKDLLSIGKAPYRARAGEKETMLANGEDLANFFEERGRKGIAVSRYKGLGEMNAEELWETTMNPDARVLRQVRIDDALGSDELFSILMGDQVEPRRNFIQTHALQVQNLDI